MSEDQIDRINTIFDKFLTRVQMAIERGDLNTDLLAVVVSLFDYKQGSMSRDEQIRTNNEMNQEILLNLRKHFGTRPGEATNDEA